MEQRDVAAGRAHIPAAADHRHGADSAEGDKALVRFNNAEAALLTGLHEETGLELVDWRLDEEYEDLVGQYVKAAGQIDGVDGDPQFAAMLERHFPELCDLVAAHPGKAREIAIAGELAAGRNPADLLQSMKKPTSVTLTVSTWRDRFLESRIDIDTNTTKNYRSALKRACDRFGDRAPATLTPTEVAEWVAELAKTMKPGTVQLYLIAFRLLLDRVGLDPNPARDPRVKLPKRVREEPQPPPAEHLDAIMDALGAKWRLLFVVLEQGGAPARRGRQLEVGRRRHRGDCGSASRARRRSVIERGGSTCLPGSWRQSTPRVRSRIACPSGGCSQALRRRPPSDDDEGVQDGRRAALPPARPAPSPDHALAPVRRPGA